jgi:hypothetical protein
MTKIDFHDRAATAREIDPIDPIVAAARELLQHSGGAETGGADQFVGNGPWIAA